MTKHKSILPFTLGVPAIAWQLLFFYFPLVIIIFTSFTDMESVHSFGGFTLKKFSYFLTLPYMQTIAASLLLALTNAILCLLIAYPLAYYITFYAKGKATVLLSLLFIPFLTNFLLHVFAWFYVLEKYGVINLLLLKIGIISAPLEILNTPFAIMVMMVYFYLPFMVIPLYGALDRFDVRLLEASYDLGASRWQTIRKILIPMTAKGIRTGFFLVYIPSFGEFAIPELMGGDKLYFIGNVASFFMLSEESGTFASAFTLLSAVALILSAGVLHFLFKLWTKGRSVDE